MHDESNAELPQAAQKRSYAAALIVIALVVAAVSVGGGYVAARSNITELEKQQASLRVQIAAMQQKTKRQDDVNKGIVTAGEPYKDPAGGLGLLDGKIAFTMPAGWERLPSSDCSAQSIDADVLCYDTASIALKTQASDAKDPYWNANISVFEYKKDDGTARQWFEKRYATQTLNDRDYPPALSINEDPIAGNSGLIFRYVAGSAYTNGFYVAVHGSYAVVVSAQLQYGAVYGTYPGAQPYDYRTTFDPVLKQFIGSVKFKDS